MNAKQELIIKNVEAHRQEILDAERWIWQHPQVGYTEWQANEYLIERFESLGYDVKALDRVYFAGLTKKGLKKGEWRYLSEGEVNVLKMGAYV